MSKPPTPPGPFDELLAKIRPDVGEDMIVVVARCGRHFNRLQVEVKIKEPVGVEDLELLAKKAAMVFLAARQITKQVAALSNSPEEDVVDHVMRLVAEYDTQRASPTAIASESISADPDLKIARDEGEGG